MDAALDRFRLYAETLGDLGEGHILHILQPNRQRLFRRKRFHGGRNLLIAELSLHFVRDVLRILDGQRFNALQMNAIAPQMIYVAVLGNGDQPGPERRPAARIKPLDTSSWT